MTHTAGPQRGRAGCGAGWRPRGCSRSAAGRCARFRGGDICRLAREARFDTAGPASPRGCRCCWAASRRLLRSPLTRRPMVWPLPKSRGWPARPARRARGAGKPALRTGSSTAVPALRHPTARARRGPRTWVQAPLAARLSGRSRRPPPLFGDGHAGFGTAMEVCHAFDQRAFRKGQTAQPRFDR